MKPARILFKQQKAHLFKFLSLFTTGGTIYCGIELLWRGNTHWSMFLAGGLCFILIGCLNEGYSWDMALLSQMVLSALAVTAVEFFTGLALNVWLGLGVWDYSHTPYNLCGQVCLLYTNLWFFLSLPAILLDDLIRWIWFGEEVPKYKLF